MEILTDKQAEEWCKKRGFGIYGEKYVRFAGDCRVFDIRGLPEKMSPGKYTYLGQLLVLEGTSGGFLGGLVWYHEWELHGNAVERQILQRIRSGYGVVSPPTETPGHRFDPNEEVDAAVFLSLALLFEWDGYFVSESGLYVIHVDEDRNVVLATREVSVDLLSELGEFCRINELKRGDFWYEMMCDGGMSSYANRPNA